MALSIHWKTHIDAWQISGLSQAAYCRQHQLAHSTFSARLRELRAKPIVSLLSPPVLLPIHVQPHSSPEVGFILHHAKGHRLELPVGVSASWLADLWRCLD
ncbi:MAG: IS66 family insertion sequence element accessory protein TnpB [Methylobacter sp.]|nr:IS66 family insertion sequence element accessory protein TnpB [Methylobacter sp.]